MLLSALGVASSLRLEGAAGRDAVIVEGPMVVEDASERFVPLREGLRAVASDAIEERRGRSRSVSVSRDGCKEDGADAAVV